MRRLRLEAKASTCVEAGLDARLRLLVDAEWGTLLCYEKSGRTEALLVVEVRGVDELVRLASKPWSVTRAAERLLEALGLKPHRVALVVHLERRLPRAERVRLARLYPRLASLRVETSPCIEVRV